MKQFHLWRNYPQRPHRRFACTIEEDPKVPGGYMITRADGDVAGIAFLQTLQNHFTRPVRAMASAGEYERGKSDAAVVLYPGDPKYFNVAVRQVPSATIGAAP